jgi:hypothetical protein
MPRAGFKPMIPVFERVKTVHSLDRAATVMGTQRNSLENIASAELLYYN